MIENISALVLKDGYKVDHRSQYVEGTQFIDNNFCPRSSRDGEITSIIWTGIQYTIMEYLIDRWNRTFFQLPKETVVLKYKRRIDNYIGKDKITYKHIEDLHDLGYLPIRIKALPEGSLVPMGVPVMTCINTVLGYGWLAQMLETLISTSSWKMPTSATTAYEFRKRFEKHAIKTGYDRSFVKWQGHDFSMRGMSGIEDGLMSGFAHLTSFFGSDTIGAIDFAEMFYGADCEKELIAGTVPATEHSVMSLGIKQGGELELLRNLITKIYPDGIVSIVMDTNDYWTNVDVHLRLLKDEIMARNGRVVDRPDSGDPVRIICGYREDEIVRLKTGEIYITEEYFSGIKVKKELTEIEVKGSWQCLWDIFGGTISKTGYKLLDTHIGLIYGDAINKQRQNEILDRLEEKGFAFNNGVLGMGSYGYNLVTRDTYRWAIKATWAQVNDIAIELSKDPKTDSGFKKSAVGLLMVYKGLDGILKLKDRCTSEEEQSGLLEVVFENSKLIRTTTLAEIRTRVEMNLERELALTI